MMKMKNPDLKVVRFACDDVIATSQFILFDESNDSYTLHNGYMSFYDSDAEAWVVNSTAYLGGMGGAEDVASYRDSQSYREDLYDAYKDPDSGTYYTKGVSVYELYHQQ